MSRSSSFGICHAICRPNLCAIQNVMSQLSGCTNAFKNKCPRRAYPYLNLYPQCWCAPERSQTQAVNTWTLWKGSRWWYLWCRLNTQLRVFWVVNLAMICDDIPCHSLQWWCKLMDASSIRGSLMEGYNGFHCILLSFAHQLAKLHLLTPEK